MKIVKFDYSMRKGVKKTVYDQCENADKNTIRTHRKEKGRDCTLFIPKAIMGVVTAADERQELSVILDKDDESKAKFLMLEYLKTQKQAMREKADNFSILIHCLQPDVPNELTRKLYRYVKDMLEICPDADPKVLQFISNLVSHVADDDSTYEVIRSTFRAGYCWHFAHILETAFGRGEVCWAAPYGHFVWVDDNGIAYDVEGLNQGEQYYNIPEEYLGGYTTDFKHVPGDLISEITNDEIIRIIRKYEDDNGLEHQDIRLH